MRAFIVIALCLMPGITLTAEHKFRVGKQYTFLSKSESLAGIPKLSGQDAGYRLRRIITVIAKDAETIVIVPKVQRVIQVNEETNDDDASEQQDSSRDTSTSFDGQEVHIPLQQQHWLEAPFEAKYKNGALQSLRTEQNTPEWVINMQRALAQRFSLNIQRATDLSQKSDFTVIEENIHGTGPVKYNVVTLSTKNKQGGHQIPEGSNKLGINQTDFENYSSQYAMKAHVQKTGQGSTHRHDEGKIQNVPKTFWMKGQHQHLEGHHSSTSSFFRSGKFHPHFRGRGCGPGPSTNYPRRNDPCYRVNTGQNRPASGSCNSYLHCTSDKCQWTEFFCGNELFWDQSQERCVPRLDTDCANAIFGENYKMFVVHISTGKVITDMANGNDWNAITDIIVKDRIKPDAWNQVFVPKQLQYGGYFNFAFNKNVDSKYKVMTAINGKPKSKIWTSENQPAQQWRALPTDQDNQFQIVNVLTRQALTVTDKSGGRGSFVVELRQSNQKDKAQLFRFKAVEE